MPDRIILCLVALCVATLCVGEIHATFADKPHSELFDATLGSLIGYAVGRASGGKSKEIEPSKEIKPPK